MAGHGPERVLNLLRRALLHGCVGLLPILFALEKQTVLACGCIEAPRPESALVELVAANTLQRGDLLSKLRVLFLQSRSVRFSDLEFLDFFRFDYVVAAANQRDCRE